MAFNTTSKAPKAPLRFMAASHTWRYFAESGQLVLRPHLDGAGKSGMITMRVRPANDLQGGVAALAASKHGKRVGLGIKSVKPAVRRPASARDNIPAANPPPPARVSFLRAVAHSIGPGPPAQGTSAKPPLPVLRPPQQ